MSFSAVPNINNGDNLIFKTGLSAVPVQKKGTTFSKKVGFSAVPIIKNGYFEIMNVRLYN